MAGKKKANVDPKTIKKIMMQYIKCGSLAETARAFPDMPSSTVKCIVIRNRDKNEYKQLQTYKKEAEERAAYKEIDQFEENASQIIELGSKLLRRRVERALECEDQIDALAEAVSNTAELNDRERKQIFALIDEIRMQTRDVSTMVGTMYDKRALARGESTDSISISVKLPPEADPYAG